MRVLLPLFAASALLALPACETDPDLGYSVRRAVASQAVDMNPTYAGVPIEGSSGVRAIDAQRRYLKGEPRVLGKIDGTVDQTGGLSGSTGGGREGGAAAANSN
ncbi:MAG: hypothetical protein ACMVO5_11290 [Polymorphobacter sp.]|uniref:hypothetical protein n=1 Tax=Polymorphobacter sp. TaxID=1909290 RepID=UPI003A89C729